MLTIAAARADERSQGRAHALSPFSETFSTSLAYALGEVVV